MSNNSSAAVAAYLSAHGIDADVVMGRTSPDPSLLKPSPHLVVEAMQALEADPHREAFVALSASMWSRSGGLVWEGEFDRPAGEVNEGEGGVGGVESVGAAGDEADLVVERFGAGVGSIRRLRVMLRI